MLFLMESGSFMTDRAALKAAGLSDDEIDEMQAWGTDTAVEMHTENAYNIAQKYLDAGMGDKAEEVLDKAFSTATYWHEIIQDLTERSISYDDPTKRWRDDETGQFVADPYNVIRQSDAGFNQSLIEKYG
jgi:hypothetical protein